MRELSLVLPSNVWLTNLTAHREPERHRSTAAAAERRPARLGPGPALELNGCATGQEAVAGFVTALKDIDGVTRVGVEILRTRRARTATAASGGAGGSADCRTRDFIAQFQIVVAFDAAPVPSGRNAKAKRAPRARTGIRGIEPRPRAESEGG